MKLIKVSGYLVEVDGQTKENIEFFLNGHFYTQQLHVEESEIFEDERVLEPNCDLAHLEEHFNHSIDVGFDRPLPQRGENWKHFKEGNIVYILGVAEDTEFHEKSVIYQHIDGTIWSRPLSMFMSEVDMEKYPDAKQKYRFEKVNKNEI